MKRDKKTSYKFFISLVLIFLTNSLVGLTVGVTLYLVGMNLTDDQARQIFVQILPIAAPLYFFISIGTTYLLWKPIHHFFSSSEKELSKDITTKALASTINLPVNTFWRAEFATLGGFLFPLVLCFIIWSLYFNLNLAFWQIVVAGLFGILVTTGHAFIEYYLVEKVSEPYRSFIARHAESIEEVNPLIYNVKIRTILSVVFAYAVVLPFLVLGISLVLKTIDNLHHFLAGRTELWMGELLFWAVVIFIMTMLITFTVVYLLSNVFIKPIQVAIKNLDQVQEGVYSQVSELSTINEYKKMYEGLNRMSRGLSEKEALKTTFGKYVPDKKFIENVMEGSSDILDQEKDITVLFCTIKDFFSIFSILSPTERVEFLNSFFTEMVPIINKYDGMLDKFTNAGFLALFGSLKEDPDHALHAVNAAIDIQNYLSSFMYKLENEVTLPIDVAIGINSGKAIVGNIGSENRQEFTAIGDTVNLAHRLMTLADTLNKNIIVSAATYEKIKGPINTQNLGSQAIRGKSKDVDVYEIKTSL